MEWLFLLNLAAAFFCTWLAREKNRDLAVWFVLGCLFGILALVAIAGMPKAEIKTPSEFITETVPTILATAFVIALLAGLFAGDG